MDDDSAGAERSRAEGEGRRSIADGRSSRDQPGCVLLGVGLLILLGWLSLAVHVVAVVEEGSLEPRQTMGRSFALGYLLYGPMLMLGPSLLVVAGSRGCPFPWLRRVAGVSGALVLATAIYALLR